MLQNLEHLRNFDDFIKNYLVVDIEHELGLFDMF